MLTALQLQEQRRRRAVPSLKQQYHEYILQRIESYKNSLSRRELLDLGDMAISEMETAQGEQFLLTEVLLTDWVDRLFHRRLGLEMNVRHDGDMTAARAQFRHDVLQVRRVRVAQRDQRRGADALSEVPGMDQAGPTGANDTEVCSGLIHLEIVPEESGWVRSRSSRFICQHAA